MSARALSMAPAAPPAPVEPKARVLELDMLRGLAVLGILAVNAEAFAWPLWTQFGEPPIAFTPADRVGDWVVETFFQDRFRTLFSLLFGVSVFLVGGDGGDPVRNRLLGRRLAWLAASGLVHGALLWWGDILLHYAYCGLIAAQFRSWPARKLLWVGGGVTGAWALIALAGPLLGAGDGGSGAEAQSMGQMAGYVDRLARDAVDGVRGGGAAALVENLKAWAVMQGFSLLLIPITAPLMLLGLGLYKAGYFTGAPTGAHLALVAVAAAILAALGRLGWPGAAAGQADPGGEWTRAVGGLDVLITLGYASLLILLSRRGLRPLARGLAAVGRMAFTNYLAQTLVMTALFVAPFGPRLYATLGPAALWGVVGAVWIVQLVVSPLWLRLFRHGPFEWAWRSLTYGGRLPIRTGR